MRLLKASNPARAAALAAVPAGEEVLSHAVVTDLAMGNAEAYLVVTTERFVWSYRKRPDIVLQGTFERVHSLGQDGLAVKITQRDPAYAEMLSDDANPFGETDAIFNLGRNVRLLDALLLGARSRSIYVARRQEAPHVLASRRTTSVSAWRDSPCCRSSFSAQSEHSIRCADCGRYFSDPGYEPDVGEAGANHGALLGDKRYLALLETEIWLADWPTPRILRPAHYSVGPLLAMDWDLLTEAREAANGSALPRDI